MSRWRESLCGSVLKSTKPELEGLNVIMGHTSDVLTCGGKFMPRSTQKAYHALKDKKIPTIISLPKEGYEVVLCDSNSNVTHHGQSRKQWLEDFDILESTFAHWDTKLSK